MDSFKRQVARKVRIRDLVQGRYIKVDGEWEPNYILADDGTVISRANIISVVASEPVLDTNFKSFVIDDGTGRVPIRVFGEESKKLDVRLGDIILLIGRPREFGQQIYIVPEIIKKITNTRWIDYRKLELELLYGPKSETGISEKEDVKKQPETEEIADEKQPVAEEESTETESKTSDNPIDRIIALIRDIDKGEGADTEEVISLAKTDNAEKIINNLLKEGEIFEVRSGRIKLLE